jgi:hypothetical protein
MPPIRAPRRNQMLITKKGVTITNKPTLIVKNNPANGYKTKAGKDTA